MRSIYLLLSFVAWGLLLPAQSPGYALMDQAKALFDQQQYYEAAKVYQQCCKKYPEAVRTHCDRYVIGSMSITHDDPDIIGARLVNQLIRAYAYDGHLRSDDTCFVQLFRKYPFADRYNVGRYLYALTLEDEGKEDEGEQVLQEILAEELAAPCPSEAGFAVATHLAERSIQQKQYPEAIAYQRLTSGKLHQQLPCGNARGSGEWVLANIGLAYAGLHQEDSALFYLGKIAFMEDPYSREDSTLALDSLIALLSRQDATPLIDRLNQAIEAIEFKDSVVHAHGRHESNEIQCHVRLGNLRFRLVWDYYGSRDLDAGDTESRFHKEWPFPYTKETCQAMVKASPFYRRAMGEAATTLFQKMN